MSAVDEPPAPAPAPVRTPLPGRRSLLIRSAIYLVVALGISNLLVMESIDSGPVGVLREGIAEAAAFVLTQLGMASSASGDRVLLPRSAVQIVNACTGLDVSVLLAASVLVFPATWKARAIGVLMSFGVILSLNFIRVLTLCYFINSQPDMFELSHVYIWPAVISVLALATLLVWIQGVALRDV